MRVYVGRSSLEPTTKLVGGYDEDRGIRIGCRRCTTEAEVEEAKQDVWDLLLEFYPHW